MLGKLSSLLKIAIYITLSFASSFALQPMVLFFYQTIPDKALFCFLISLFDLLLAALLLFLFGHFFEKRTFLSYGFGGTANGAAIKEFVAGVGTGGLLVSTVMLILFFAGCYTVVSAGWHIEFLTYLPFFIVAAMREEVMFRGYVFQTLEKAWGTIGAILWSSAMFGFLHWINFGQSTHLEDKLYSCACLTVDAGLIFAVAYLVKRRLWYPFGLHLSWNIFEGPVYGTLVSSLSLGTPLLTAVMKGPNYMTGGVFGPEASLVEVGVCLVLIGILWKLVPRQKA